MVTFVFPFAELGKKMKDEIKIIKDVAAASAKKETESKIVEAAAAYPAKKMTHYIMDGKDASKCIAGKWCIAKDTSIRYKGYFVWAVHCSVIKKWRGSLIKVYYKDGGVETGIVLDCGGFAGHKDRMDKAMGARRNGKINNATLTRTITKTEVLRQGW